MRNPLDKIRDLRATIAWRAELHAQGRRLVLTNGCFDMLHRGHVEYLYQARTAGDALLVATNTDHSVQAVKGPSRPIVPQADRAYQLASLEAVDGVVYFDTPDAIPIIEAVRPQVYVKGGDYTLDTINQSERKVLERLGVEIVFKSFIPGYSTTRLISRIREE
jgi:rfaE bifunctional protein nucleotidyltransferase chain/domain